jgi:protein-S-isoprenylcysteine O-methyltransferase Ste14
VSRRLYARVALRLLLSVPAAGLLLFVPAGTFDYWQAWVFATVFFACNVVLTAYLIVQDPQLLERRMKAGPAAEQSGIQKIIVLLTLFVIIGIAVVPGLDRRFGWSQVPASVVILGNLALVLSHFGFYRVFRANTYGASTIRVEEGQRVISTGPYAFVRHPMYAAALLLFFSMPLALGSWWGLALMVPGILLLAWRLLNEEEFLRQNLPGYTEYTRRVRYRLMPYVW